ncbi:hypothetical protein B0H34DRAFT_676828 [Crassisporium funariophilum]|nr:hypothetical protein B0H34DRAFT_676828 [Crassisporium funariophilum]
MIILLLLYIVSGYQHTQAIPVESNIVGELTSTLFTRVDRNCNVRSIWNIIWSCLATVFACTWIAIHPNVPAPSDNPWTILGRRMKLMMSALLAPELIVMWAARQWLGARKIAKRYEGRKWTKTHGFFAIMGGFMLFENGQAIRTLTTDELAQLASDGDIEWPTISEGEIQDRSKGDYLSKGIVIIQVSWFIAQCISRAVSGLVITELEIVTVAFAALNGIMYFLWWNKPLDVRYAVPVQLLRRVSVDKAKTRASLDIPPVSTEKVEAGMPGHHSLEVPPTTTKGGELSNNDQRQTIIGEEPVLPRPSSHGNTELSDYILEAQQVRPPYRCSTIGNLFASIRQRGTALSECCRGVIKPVIHKLHASIHRTHEEYGAARTVYHYISKPIIGLLWFLDGPFGKDSFDDDTPTRAPTFYAPEIRRGAETRTFALVLTVASGFGALHCVAWFFTFPSTSEMWMWRISSIIIAVNPIVFTVIWHTDFLQDSFGQSLPDAYGIILVFISITYIIARVILLILPLLALRSLPIGAYDDVDWSSILPHI